MVSGRDVEVVWSGRGGGEGGEGEDEDREGAGTKKKKKKKKRSNASIYFKSVDDDEGLAPVVDEGAEGSALVSLEKMKMKKRRAKVR